MTWVKRAGAHRATMRAVFSAAFRPFFLGAALWSAAAVPAWLLSFSGRAALPGALAPFIWHVHEMVFGFGFATIAGFLLTAIPNWTGRLPLRGPRLAALAGLWLAGRLALLLSASIGPHAAAAIDLAFPAALIAVVARELVAGRNWRNLPMLAALALLLCGSLLVHLQSIGLAYTALLGNRIGIATLLMLIALIGGRIVPSFTRNWLAKQRAGGALPAPAGRLDLAALAITLAALAAWVAFPGGPATPWLALAASLALGLRLSRWRGLATLGEPLLFVLHAGYGWLVVGFGLLGLSGVVPLVPHSAALHALAVGAIGTMTLAVMTRATLGHSGQPLSAGGATVLVYLLVTVAALLRIAAPLAGASFLALTWAAAAAWSGAFLLFAFSYRKLLLPGKHVQAPRR
ncbi:MAG TPA: NnrS family protein [Burkholderiales bacterium]